MSQDGAHWAGAFPLHAKDTSDVHYVGIGHGNGLDQPGHIKLRRIVQRRLIELSSLVPADVLARAIVPAAAPGMAGVSFLVAAGPVREAVMIGFML